MDPENAVALKSQLDLYKKRKRLPVDMRKTKIREYKRWICPLCSKGVTRLKNHLCATYKIKNYKKFRHVMDEAQYVDVIEEKVSEWDTNDDSSDKYLEVKTILSTGGKRYLKVTFAPISIFGNRNKIYNKYKLYLKTNKFC